MSLMELKEVDVKNIYVDLSNPRFHPKDNEEEQIEEIINSSKILPLCADIAKHGLDPSENILTTFDEESEIYIVREGNRRITALKILNNPEVIPVTVKERERLIIEINSFRNKFNYKNINKITVIVGTDVEKLNHFILIKHTGSNEGAGRVGWDVESVTRFKKKPFDTLLLKTVTSLIEHKGSSINFSTIRDRIITDPDLRSFFDITIDRAKPEIVFHSAKGKNAFVHVLNGLLNKTYTVGDFHGKQDRMKFIAEFPINQEITESEVTDFESPDIYNYDSKEPEEENDYIKPIISTNPIETPLTIDTLKTDENENNSNNEPIDDLKNKGGRPRKSPSEFDYLISAYFFKNKYTSNKRINQVIRELTHLEYKKSPVASMFLLRAVLEAYVNEYINYFASLHHENPLKMKGINPNREKRDKKLRLLLYDDIHNHLKNVIQDFAETYELIHATFTTNNNTSVVQIVNFHIHSGSDYPDTSEILEAWKRISQIVTTLDILLEQNSGQG